MPDQNCHIQYASCMLIAVPLNGSCQIVSGAASTVIAGIVEVNGEVEREDGTDYSAKTFAGVNCGPELRGPDLDKWMNLDGQMCLVDWGFQSQTSGNPLVVDDDGNVVGYQELVSQAGSDPCGAGGNPPKVAMAIIRRAAVGSGACEAVTSDTGATPLVIHEFPNATSWKWTDSGWKDERNLRSFTAKGYNNPQIGAGPFNLWPAAYTPDSIDVNAYHSEAFIPTSGLPAAGCATVAHPAPAVRGG